MIAACHVKEITEESDLCGAHSQAQHRCCGMQWPARTSREISAAAPATKKGPLMDQRSPYARPK